VIAPVESSAYRLEELLAQITADNQHEELDWGAPVGQETW
jgi:antitoxin component of MazEF toxin-antitoxin module